jgi:hypothetical protein
VVSPVRVRVSPSTKGLQRRRVCRRCRRTSDRPKRSHGPFRAVSAPFRPTDPVPACGSGIIRPGTSCTIPSTSDDASSASSRASAVAMTTAGFLRAARWSIASRKSRTSRRGGQGSGATRVRTGSRSEQVSTRGSSGRCESRPDPSTHRREIQRYRELLAHTVPLAVELGHEPTLSFWDGDEVLCACGRCNARGYGDVTEAVFGGALFEDECPNEQPPALTALAMTYIAGPRRPRGSLGGHREV